MKKVMFLMAVAGMFAFAACNNTPAPEETIDTTVPETEMVEEEVIDTTVPETAAEETTEVVAE